MAITKVERNPFFKGMSEKECAAKYAHKAFGTWKTSTVFLRGSTWYANVVCTECGTELIASISCLSKHGKCNCKKFLREKELRNPTSGFLGLEKVWPTVVKAGQRVMRKHKHAMAKV